MANKTKRIIDALRKRPVIKITKNDEEFNSFEIQEQDENQGGFLAFESEVGKQGVYVANASCGHDLSKSDVEDLIRFLQDSIK